jgi:hypothetical protein
MVALGRSVAALVSNDLVFGTELGVVAAALALTGAGVLDFPKSDTLHNVPLLLALSAIPPSIVAIYTNGLLVLEGRIKQLNLAALLAGIVQLTLCERSRKVHRTSAQSGQMSRSENARTTTPLRRAEGTVPRVVLTRAEVISRSK